jgi:hypothetical protein
LVNEFGKRIDAVCATQAERDTALAQIGSSSRQAGSIRLVAHSRTKIVQKSVITRPAAGATQGRGLCWPTLMHSAVESAGQIVEQLLDLDFSRKELLLQRIGDDGLQCRAACVETERQKINLARLGQPGGVFSLQQ